jgi:hypothetical protein
MFGMFTVIRGAQAPSARLRERRPALRRLEF